MQLTRKAIGMTAAFGIIMLAGQTWADDADSLPSSDDVLKILAEAGKPGPEHAKLQPLAGTWTYACKFWMDPTQPPLESTGTVERKWVLGGRFLEEKIVGTGFDGKPGFEARGLVGYDNARKQYTASWNCCMNTGTCTALGACDESGRKFTFQTEAFCPVLKKIVKGREEIRIESNDRIVASSYITEDGKEFKMMELVSVRKK